MTRTTLGALVVSLCLLVAASLAVIWQWTDYRGDARSTPVAAPATQLPSTSTAPDPVTDEILTAADKLAVALLTVNWQTVDADVARILAGSTGSFHEDFAKSAPGFIDVVRAGKSVSTGAVNASALESREGDTGTVLVAATATSTLDGAAQAPRYWRLRMVMVSVGGHYLGSTLEFVS